MNAKTVRCMTSEPISLDPHYRQYWADVWIQFKTGPNNRHYHAPTLISLGDIQKEIDSNIWGLEYYKNPETVKEYNEANQKHGREIFKDITAEDMYQHCVDDKVKNENLLEKTLKKGMWIDPNYGKNKNIPSIYTSNEYIDRFEAERMLRLYMNSLGYKNVKFRWKRPRRDKKDGKYFLITPV
jgi:hypothetical protein